MVVRYFTLRGSVCWFRFVLLCSVLLLSFLLTMSWAQISLDGSLGPSGPLTGPDYVIPSAVGQIRGENVFHSFGQFNIQTGESATFTGPDTITNILSRVTGGDPSTIDGPLRSEITGANVFLINPRGVMFGPNARLEVSGSFHVGTADRIHFDDEAIFSTNLREDTTLTIAAPIAFGFLSEALAAVHVQASTLEVLEKKTLSLMGGSIDIQGGPVSSFDMPTLKAPSGRIHIVSVAPGGEMVSVPFIQSLSRHGSDVADFGNIHISNNAFIDVSGNGGGTVVIRGNRLLLDHSSIIASTRGDMDGNPLGIDIQMTDEATLIDSALTSVVSAGSRGDAGDIIITAPRVSLSEISTILSLTLDAGDGGEVSISAREVSLATNSSIIADAIDDGNAGTVTIEATDQLTMTGNSFISNNSSFMSGKGGDIAIKTGVLSLDESRITSAAFGPRGGGSVIINAMEVNLTNALLSTEVFGDGDGGDIIIIATTVNLTETTTINADTKLGSGNTGDVTIAAIDVNLTGGSLISAETSDGSSGASGAISIMAKTVTLTDEAFISSTTLSPGNAGSIIIKAGTITLANESLIISQTLGSGSGGNISIDGDHLTMTGGSQISSSTFGVSQGGVVEATATDTIMISGRSQNGARPSGIFANASGRGLSAGNARGIMVEARSLIITSGGRITSSSLGGGQGGQVTIRGLGVEEKPTNRVLISGQDSGIFTTADGNGDGGGITIQAREAQLSNGAVISAQSTRTGDAGGIGITTTDTLLLSENSNVTTAAQVASGGMITVKAGAMVSLRDSDITSSVSGLAGTVGGDIAIDSEFVILDNSQVLANAFQGRGGDITIDSDVFLADPDSVVDARALDAQVGIDGEVDIQAPVTNLSGSLTRLPQNFAAAPLPSRCAERWRGGNVSRFVVSGREGLPAKPGHVLPSQLAEVVQETTGVNTTGRRFSAISEVSAGRRLVDMHGYARLENLPTIQDLECAKW